MSDATSTLHHFDPNEPGAAETLLRQVYAELRRLAAARMAREAAHGTLQPTALVHEAWLRLGGDQQPAWRNRAHFFSAAAEAMRRILIERARRRQAGKHGGHLARDNFADVNAIADLSEDDQQVIDVHEALEKFSALDPQKAELVKLRYFAGLTLPEVADVLDIPEGTAKRWWTYARAWLIREIKR